MGRPNERHDRRVLRVIGRLNIGGPARHVVILADHLRSHGYTTRIVHGRLEPGEGSLEDLPRHAGVETTPLVAMGRRLRPWTDLAAMVTVYRLARRERPAVIHTHTSKAGAVGRIAAWLYNRTVPRDERCLVVHTFHGHVFEHYFSPLKSRVVRVAERALARITDDIVALSPAQARDLTTVHRIAPASKVRVVPPGFELDALLTRPEPDRSLRRALRIPDEAFVFGYVGRLVPIKNLALLLAAFAEMSREHPSAMLVVVGDGGERPALEALAVQLGVGDCVRFAGWQRSLSAIHGGLDAVVISSRSEGVPVSLVEAMAAGRPVVATRVGGIVDLVEHGATGLLVAPDDVGALAEAMKGVLGMDPVERAAMGDRARKDVASRFTADRLAGDIARLYAAPGGP